MKNQCLGKPITSKEQKQIMVEMLNSIHEFCDKNGIKYYLAYGTLIGAIRHKGFIPWDDDVDIVMLRDDYERFISKYNEENYSLICLENTPNYYLPIAKVCDNRTILREDINDAIDIGVYVDVCPIDYLSNDIVNARRLVNKIVLLNRLLLVKSITLSRERALYKQIILGVAKFVLFPVEKSVFLKKIQGVSKKYRMERDSKYCGEVSLCTYGQKEILETKWFEDGTILVDFEGLKLCAPKCYDDILTNLYGDYMTPPPVEEQATHHSYDAFWKE